MCRKKKNIFELCCITKANYALEKEDEVIFLPPISLSGDCNEFIVKNINQNDSQYEFEYD